MMDVNRLALIASILSMVLAIAVQIPTDINGGMVVPAIGGEE